MRASLAALVAAAASNAAAAGDVKFSFERLLGSDTPLPTDSEFFFGAFAGFRLVHRDSRVMFANFARILPPSLNGVFEHGDTGVHTFAVSGQNPFDHPLGFFFEDPHFDGDTSVFWGAGPEFDESAIYVSSGGSEATRLVGTGDPINGGASVTAVAFTPRVLGDQVVFGTLDESGANRLERVPAAGGVPQMLFDASSPLEPEGADYDLTAYALGGTSGDRFAFWGETASGLEAGIFVSDLDGNVVPVARRGEPAPGGEGQVFSSFIEFPSLDGETVGFSGRAVGGVSTVYTADTATGAIEAVVDVTSPVINEPNSGLPVITTLRAASVSGGNVGFIGQSSSGFTQALFVMFGGELLEIARNREMFDGKMLRVLTASPFSLDGNQYVFAVEFTDGSTGLYRATIVPGPASVLLTLTQFANLAFRRRRRP